VVTCGGAAIAILALIIQRPLLLDDSSGATEKMNLI
jgi:hypothetical protein